MPTLPVRRDAVERLAHDALDAARHPVRTARATADAARHPVRTAQAAADQLRTAVMTVAGRVAETSLRDGGTPPPTDAPADVDASPASPSAPAAEPVKQPAKRPVKQSAKRPTKRPAKPPIEEVERPAEAVELADQADQAMGTVADADEDGARGGDEIAPGLGMPLTPRPHISAAAERDIAGELDPDPETTPRRRRETESLGDPGTAKAIRKEAQRAARASDPASRRRK